LPYPGGPLIDKYAQQGNALAFKFAEPNIPNLNFSFSGLKTSVYIFCKNKMRILLKIICQIYVHLYKYSIVNILIKKLKKAVQQTNIQQVCLAGGVSANSGLRNALIENGKKFGWQTFMPKFEYCTDNAAMIAITGYYKFLANQFCDLSISPSARTEISA
jgi:N6-L-threonylcarbamoyladenine synthase